MHSVHSFLMILIKSMFYFIHTSIHEMDIEFWETFARKFPKLKQLVVSNLTQVQRAVSKTETTSSFEPN
jgi:hypothetical protein